VYIYTVTCQNCKKRVPDERHLTLVTRQEWGKTKCGIGVQKFICDECIDNLSKKDIISDD
jgi:uncharacterized protein YlaI